MRYWLIILFCAFGNISVRADADTVWKWFSPELRDLERQQRDVRKQLENLGEPVIGPTAVQFGYQHPRMPQGTLVTNVLGEVLGWEARRPFPAWVEIDLLASQPIDSITLVPAQVDWQSSGRPSYGFPVRFRVEVSDTPIIDPKTKKSSLKNSIVVADFTRADFPNPGMAPFTVHCKGHKARYVRLIVTKMVAEDRHIFFALSEIMVMAGNLNVAINGKTRASAIYDMTARWTLNNLVDGRTPFGPPIKRELQAEDGLYTGPDTIDTNALPWMILDLGRIYPLQQLRLHPVHAWLGADIPGFSFPPSFKVETSVAGDFADAVTLISATNYPNPGNNPVTLWATNLEARFIKISALSTNVLNERRFGLSEVEVYSGGRNVARSNAVASHIKPLAGRDRDWPTRLLVDGYTSYGKLMELPEWLESWDQRTKLLNEQQQFESWESGLVAQAQRRAAWTGGGVGIFVLLAVCGFVAASHYRRRNEMEDLRLRLTRDIHDEIGSNLAGIAMLSEVALESAPEGQAQKKDWNEVNHIAQETLGAMREVLWLVDPREETSLDLMKHLQLAASRMLVGKEVRWKAITNELPADWPAESRRQVFLIFKESLTNIIRHAHARSVELSAEVREGEFCLSVTDDGCGFDPEKIKPGIGTGSLQIRAQALRGTVKIDSAPGRGTTILLEAPLGKIGRLRWWSSQLKNLFQKRHARRLAYRG